MMQSYSDILQKSFKNGIYLAPSAFEAMFVSLAHTEKNIEKTIKAAEKSLKQINNL